MVTVVERLPVGGLKQPEQGISREELSLDTTYSVLRDVRTGVECSRENTQHLTSKQIEYFIQQNLVAFAGEFGAERKLMRQKGIATDDGRILMCSRDLLEMAQTAAAISGPQSYEAAELVQMKSIYTALQEGATQVHIVSPARGSPGDNSYTVVMSLIVDPEQRHELGGRLVTEHITTHRDTVGDLTQSEALYRYLQDDGGAQADPSQFHTGHDFVANPIISAGSGLRTPDAILRGRGITEEDIVFADRFDAALYEHCAHLFEEYASLTMHIVSQLSNSTDPHVRGMLDLMRDPQSFVQNEHTIEATLKNHPSTGMLYQRMRDIRDLVYVTSKRIATELRTTQSVQETANWLISLQQAQFHSSQGEFQTVWSQQVQNEAYLTRGTSCPVSRQQESVTTMSERAGLFGVSPVSYRALFGQRLQPRNYEFKSQGTCRVCGSKHEKVGLLGPCKICKRCDELLNKGTPVETIKRQAREEEKKHKLDEERTKRQEAAKAEMAARKRREKREARMRRRKEKEKERKKEKKQVDARAPTARLSPSKSIPPDGKRPQPAHTA